MGKLLAPIFILIYLAISIAPVLITFLDHPPPPNSFIWEYSAALGYIGMILIILQFAITDRVKLIEKQFGADIILQFHKQIGIVLFLIIVLHPLLLFVAHPEILQILNPSKMPIKTFFALLSFLCLLLLMALSIFRKQLKLSYEVWRISHGFFAIGTLGFGLLHALKVDRYLNLYWKGIFWDILVLYVILHLIWARIFKPLWRLRKPWQVVGVKEEKGNCWTLSIKPLSHQGLKFASGQFAYLRLKSSPIWYQEHPFTISSSSEDSSKIDFTIKELGDFTKTIKDVRPGSIAYVEGPYGVFSQKFYPKAKSLCLLAGGIGITPMISILRTMKDQKDPKKVTLFYAVNKETDLTFLEELKSLEDHLNLKTVLILNNPEPGWFHETGYLELKIIEKYVPELSEPYYFLCGPPAFNRNLKKGLRVHKVPYNHIHVELFQIV